MNDNPIYDKALAEYKTKIIRQLKGIPLSSADWEWANHGFNEGWRACGKAIKENIK